MLAFLIAAAVVAQADTPAGREITVQPGQTAVVFLNPNGEVVQVVRLLGGNPQNQPAQPAQPATRPLPPITVPPPISVPNGRFGGAKAAVEIATARLTAADKQFVPGVRQNFLNAAAAIDSGQIKDADAVNNYLKTKNRDLLAASPGGWIAFFMDAKAFTDKLHSDQRLRTLADYSILFREFADGLEAAARSSVQSASTEGVPPCPKKQTSSPRSSRAVSPANLRLRLVRLPATF